MKRFGTPFKVAISILSAAAIVLIGYSAITFFTVGHAQVSSNIRNTNNAVELECTDRMLSAEDIAAIEKAEQDRIQAEKDAEWQKQLDVARQKNEPLVVEPSSDIEYSYFVATGPGKGRYTDPYLIDVTWNNDAEYMDAMKTIADSKYSSSGWFIAVDYNLCRMTIMIQDGQKQWQTVKAYNGNYGTASYAGLHSIVHKMPCNWDDRFFGQGINDWSSCYIEYYGQTGYTYGDMGQVLRYVEGKGYEDCASIHGTSGSTTGYGQRGCLGLRNADAKWVYDNVPIGTPVYIFEE